MAVTGIGTLGKYELFHNGWTTRMTWAKLYTSADVLVDEQTVALSWNGTNKLMEIVADVVFDVAGGTNDVSYVIFGTGTAPDIVFYTEVFAVLYDFATAGTLTLDSARFTLSSSYITDLGKEELSTAGWETIVTAKLYAAGAVLLDTQTVAFSTATTGIMTADAAIVFDVADNTAYAVDLLNVGAEALYYRVLPVTAEFVTPGTLTISSWAMTI